MSIVRYPPQVVALSPGHVMSQDSEGSLFFLSAGRVLPQKHSWTIIQHCHWTNQSEDSISMEMSILHRNAIHFLQNVPLHSPRRTAAQRRGSRYPDSAGCIFLGCFQSWTLSCLPGTAGGWSCLDSNLHAPHTEAGRVIIRWYILPDDLTLVWSTLLLQYLGRVCGYTSPLWMEHTRSAMDCLHWLLLALFMALRGS